jgi:hypothetical protein
MQNPAGGPDVKPGFVPGSVNTPAPPPTTASTVAGGTSMTTTSRMPDAEWVDVDQYDENLVKGILFRIATKYFISIFVPLHNAIHQLSSIPVSSLSLSFLWHLQIKGLSLFRNFRGQEHDVRCVRWGWNVHADFVHGGVQDML